jgi:hypothetical protein
VETKTDFIRLFAPYVGVIESDVEVAKKKRDAAIKAAAELIAKRDRMLKVEDKTEINAAIDAERIKARKYTIASRNYLERLDVSAFSLRRQDGLPVFMIVDINDGSPEFVLIVRKDGEYFTRPSLPDRAKEQFKDVVAKLRKRFGLFSFSDSVSLKAQLKTIIPEDVRPIIEKAMKESADGSKLFDEIYIVAEAPKWDIELVANTDPLVVGYSKYTDEFFVITTYNPTDLETFLKEQFATGF